jgi:uncharacterized membrane protein
MKTVVTLLIIFGIMLAYGNLFSAHQPSGLLISGMQLPVVNDPEPDVKAAAFEILQSTCNVCHKKQNPFKVFSLKNMDKHAPKIYKQVFVYKRMPKGNQIQLTEAESQTLSAWLNSQNIK